jgi:hypothetical protein
MNAGKATPCKIAGTVEAIVGREEFVVDHDAELHAILAEVLDRWLGHPPDEPLGPLGGLSVADLKERAEALLDG